MNVCDVSRKGTFERKMIFFGRELNICVCFAEIGYKTSHTILECDMVIMSQRYIQIHTGHKFHAHETNKINIDSHLDALRAFRYYCLWIIEISTQNTNIGE